MTVIPDSAFGERVRERLRTEELVWLTTVGANGMPQPNPVWFLWGGSADEVDEVLVYNATTAARLAHVAVRPHMSLNFQADEHGGDIVVITGTAERAVDVPPDEHEAYLAKYDQGIVRLGSDRAKFARDYSVALRIVFTKVRGF